MSGSIDESDLRIDELDNDGNTALHFACLTGHMEAAVYLDSRIGLLEHRLQPEVVRCALRV